MPIIRNSQNGDLAQITDIYAHHVQNGTGTFEVDPPTQTEMQQRRNDVLNKGLPYLVAVNGSQILGFSYCNWFKPRPAYRYSAEDSIYLSPVACHTGLGRPLLAELISQAQRVGVRKLIAVIGDSNNLSSMNLHRSLGFQDVGILKSCGWKFDQWLDVILMDKTIGAGNVSPPNPPN